MKNNLCTIYLIRHGKTDWNEEGLIQGHTDIPLNLEGIKQAHDMAKELRNVKFDRVYSSDLLRASRTAKIIADTHNLNVKHIKGLRERNFAQLEGRPHGIFKEIDIALAALKREERFSYKHLPDMESMEELMSRFLTNLKKIANENKGLNVLVVSHGGPMWMLLNLLNNIDTDLHTIKIENLAFIKLESDGQSFVVKETRGVSYSRSCE